MAKDIRPKTFEQGDIVYWCHNHGNGKYSVKFGMVYDQYSNVVVIDYLVLRERRYVVFENQRIFIKDFKNEYDFKRRKLPKSWSYDTELFRIEYDEITKDELSFSLDLTRPETIKEAYNIGFLVKKECTFLGQIEVDITKDGWLLVEKYPYGKDRTTCVSVNPWQVYFTYEEAKAEADEKTTEFMRQCSLTDYEWSVEQIEKDLQRYKKLPGITEDNISSIRNFLLFQNKVEDIETRIFNGDLQWKYWKKKKWSTVEVR